MQYVVQFKCNCKLNNHVCKDTLVVKIALENHRLLSMSKTEFITDKRSDYNICIKLRVL